MYDADLALHTPLELWLSTGIRALDHAVEGILADGDHPLSDTMSVESIRRLFHSLPAAKTHPQDAAIRNENQLAAWFSFTSPLQSAAGLGHTLGKQIGSPFGIPHGITSCLLMPHVMRYFARTKADRLAFMAPAMGIPAAGKSDEQLALATADAVAGLIESLGLPQHLSKYELTDEQLRTAAQPVAGATHSLEDLVAIYQAAR